MVLGGSTRVIAAVFALAAFAVAIIAGLAAGLEPHITLIRALLALVVCELMGLAIGRVAQFVAEDHLRARLAATEPVHSPQRSNNQTDQHTSSTVTTPAGA